MRGISWRVYGIGFLAACAMLLFLFAWNRNLTALVGGEGASFPPRSCPDYFDFCSVSGSEGGQQSCVRTTLTCPGGQEPVCSKTITCAVARACEGVCCRCPNSGGDKQLPPAPPPSSSPLPGTDAQHGWCCVTDGQACISMTLAQCDVHASSSGLASFALDEGVCNRLCGGGGGRGQGGNDLSCSLQDCAVSCPSLPVVPTCDGTCTNYDGTTLQGCTWSCGYPGMPPGGASGCSLNCERIDDNALEQCSVTCASPPISTTGCSATCASVVLSCGSENANNMNVCGNGVLEEGEECDDGNTTDGDGCSATCIEESTSAACGGGQDASAEQKGWKYDAVNAVFEWQYHWLRAADGHWAIVSVGRNPLSKDLLIISGKPDGSVAVRSYPGELTAAAEGFAVRFNGPGVSYEGWEAEDGEHVRVAAPGFSLDGTFSPCGPILEHGDVRINAQVVSPAYYSRPLRVSGTMTIDGSETALSGDLAENDHQYGIMSPPGPPTAQPIDHDWVYGEARDDDGNTLTFVATRIRNVGGEDFANYLLVSDGEETLRADDAAFTPGERFADGFSKSVTVASDALDFSLTLALPAASALVASPAFGLMQENGDSRAEGKYRGKAYAGWGIKESTNKTADQSVGRGRDNEEANLGLSPISATQDAAGRVTYVVHVTNFGPSAATDVRLSLGFYGATVTLVASESSPGCVWENGGVNCRLSPLAVGPPTSNTFTVKIAPASPPSCAAPLRSAISVGSPVPDPVPANNGLEHQFPSPSACAATCGNGICEAGETAQTCLQDCVTTAVCGNGIIDPGEECDGNAFGGFTCNQGTPGGLGFGFGGSLRCRQDCKIQNSCNMLCCQSSLMAGSGPVPPQCTHSAMTYGCRPSSYLLPYDMCSSSCKSLCGNGHIDDGEMCDDGNDTPWDGCTKCFSDYDPTCSPLEPTNVPNIDTINVVFAGMDIPVSQIVNVSQNHLIPYLRSLPPFSTMKRKVQFWSSAYPIPRSTDWLSTSYPLPCPPLKNRHLVVLCLPGPDNLCNGGHAHFGLRLSIIPYFDSDPVFLAGIFAHEFGHQFANLADEYIYPTGSVSVPSPPNCAGDMSLVSDAAPGSPWYYWKSLAGMQSFAGCSYVMNNYRPYDSTIMRNSGDPTYGPVNIAAMADKLRFYADNPNGPFSYAPGEGPGRSLLAQVASVDTSPYEEQALRLHLRRREDGSYEEAGREAVKISHGVIPAFAQGGSVAVRIGGRTFTQTFATEDVAITESFEEDGTIHLEEYKRTPRNDVVVEVGLGTAELVDAATARFPDGRTASVTVDVRSCDSADGVRENDCPPPMFRGEIAPPFTPAPLPSRPASPPSPSSPSPFPLAVSALLLIMGTGIGGWILFARLRRRNRKGKGEM